MVEKSKDPTAGPTNEHVRAVLMAALGKRPQVLKAVALTGENEGTLKDYGAGRTVPRADVYIRLVRALGIDPHEAFCWPRPSSGPAALDAIDPPIANDDVVNVPLLDARAAAGPGRANGDAVKAVSSIPFSTALIRKLGGRPGRVEFIRATGDSMAPTIVDGALVLIDRSISTLPSPRSGRARHTADEVWVFIHDGDDTRVKRLRPLDHGFLAIVSDNLAEYPPEIIPPADVARVKIVGRAIWWDNRL